MPAASVSIHSIRRRRTTRAGSGSSLSCDIAVTMEADQSLHRRLHGYRPRRERAAPSPVGGSAGRAVGPAHGARRVRAAGVGGGVAGDAHRRARHARLQDARRAPGARPQRRRRLASDRAPRPTLARAPDARHRRDAALRDRADLLVRRAVGVGRALAARRPARAGGAARGAPPDALAAGVGGLRIARRRPVDLAARRARARARPGRRRRLGGRARELPRRPRRARRPGARRRGGMGPRRRRRGLPRLRCALRADASDRRGGRLPRADPARPRVPEVPLPRPRPARRPAAGALAAAPRARPVPRAPRPVGGRRAGVVLDARGGRRRAVGGINRGTKRRAARSREHSTFSRKGAPMPRRTPAWRRRRRALSLVAVGVAAAIAPASAQASWPGLNGWLSFSSNRFGTALSGDIFAMPSFGLPQAQLTEVRADDAQSAWSPDGRRIAFKSRRNGNNELYVMNADGTDETRLTNSFRVSEGQPFWSPDGTRLLYRKTPDNPITQAADIWQIDVDPANPSPRPVLERPGDERYPSYSPDGTKIVFRGDEDLVDHSGDEELYVMEANGTGIVRLTSNVVFDSAPAFSPDGTKLAFESARDSGDPLALDIYVMNADGTGVRRLTADPAHDEGPIWSPDGTKIAFSSERGGSSDIWLMGADGSGVRRLTDDPARDESPDWQAVPFATAGHVACGDVGLARGAATSVVTAGRPCPAALRLAAAWAARATAGDRPRRLQGFDCTATPHTFDNVLVDCVHPPEPDEVGGDDVARHVAFVWRDPAVALPGA